MALVVACGGSTEPVPDGTTTSSGGASSSGASSSGASSSGTQGCQADALICPDGTAVGRTGPNCTFPPCPTNLDGGSNCDAIAKQCPDGTFVGPTGPNCEFVCPPMTCEALASKAKSELDAVLKAYTACDTADDCTRVEYATDCFSACTRPLAKKGVEPYAAAKKSANGNECKVFKDQKCTFAVPPCVAPLPPKCNNHICE